MGAGRLPKPPITQAAPPLRGGRTGAAIFLRLFAPSLPPSRMRGCTPPEMPFVPPCTATAAAAAVSEPGRPCADMRRSLAGIRDGAALADRSVGRGRCRASRRGPPAKPNNGVRPLPSGRRLEMHPERAVRNRSIRGLRHPRDHGGRRRRRNGVLRPIQFQSDSAGTGCRLAGDRRRRARGHGKVREATP